MGMRNTPHESLGDARAIAGPRLARWRRASSSMGVRRRGPREFWRPRFSIGAHNEVLEAAHHLPAWVLAAAVTVPGRRSIGRRSLPPGGDWRLGARYGPSSQQVVSSTSSMRRFSCAPPSSSVTCCSEGRRPEDHRRPGTDGVATVSLRPGQGRRPQTGYVYHYAFVMLLGVAGLLSFALWAPRLKRRR